MKRTRQAAILTLIQEKDVETQEELAAALKEQGFEATQAIISRDIRELRLVKVLSGSGKYKYAPSGQNTAGLSERYVRIFLSSVVSIEYAGNIIVVKTLSASADIAAEAIDSMQMKEILGTMAGENTVLVIVHNEEEARTVTGHFRGLLK